MIEYEFGLLQLLAVLGGLFVAGRWGIAIRKRDVEAWRIIIVQSRMVHVALKTLSEGHEQYGRATLPACPAIHPGG